VDMPATTRPMKITFGEMRAQRSVRVAIVPR
jgi:hypothetical protein